MGLMDILNGMQNGPRGAENRSGGGMSPITMALMGLLAYKAIRSFGGASNPSSNPGRGDAAPGGAPSGGLGLEDMLGRGLGQGSGGLGSVLGGLGAGGLGGLLTGGLGDLLEQFNGAGKGDAAKSWVGTGKNQPVSAKDMSQVLTPDQIEFLTQRTGLSREDLLSGLSEQLPRVVDSLTPSGRLPTADEMNRQV